MDSVYTQVGENFRLDGEIVVVISDADGQVEPLAQAFFKTNGGVTEWGPLPVAEVLDMADAESTKSGRQIVIQLEPGAAWHPRWGSLAEVG